MIFGKEDNIDTHTLIDSLLTKDITLREGTGVSRQPKQSDLPRYDDPLWLILARWHKRNDPEEPFPIQRKKRRKLEDEQDDHQT